MKKFFKKLNIAHSPLLRVICVFCAVATCVFPFAVSASASEHTVISIWDMPYTVEVDGDTNLVTVLISGRLASNALSVTENGVTTRYPNTQAYGFTPLSNSSYRINFYPYGYKNVFFDSSDFPSGTSVIFEGNAISSSIDHSFSDVLSSNGLKWAVGYKAYNDDLALVSQQNKLANSSLSGSDTFFTGVVPVEFPSSASLISFEFYTYFDTLTVPYDTSFFFGFDNLYLTFSISSLWLQATQNNHLNGVLDDVKEQLAEQGKTMNEVLKEQEEINDNLDNIINGTVDSTLPPDSGVIDEFENQEHEIMDSVNDGFDTALGVLEDTLISIMEMLAGFHAISYIFNLFYSLPLIQLAVNFSLVLGLFGAMLGIANMIGNKFIGKVGGKGKD